ncbi:hypothetical protein ACIA49_16650 [Kribbella sp. NPDC051587]|uniref:hypothetical protein n=1 Tax=Kribbella sp. NPDC051587 TaxID=3364119 RepID=UPI0037AEA655
MTTRLSKLALTVGSLVLAASALTALPATAAPSGNLTVHCKLYGEVVVYPGGVTNIWYFVTDNTTHQQKYVSAAYLDIDDAQIPWC